MNKYVNALYSKMQDTILTREDLEKFIKFAEQIDKMTNVQQMSEEVIDKLATGLFKYFESKGLDNSIQYNYNLNECMNVLIKNLQGKTILILDKDTNYEEPKKLLLYNIVASNGEYVEKPDIYVVEDDSLDLSTVDFIKINDLIKNISPLNSVLTAIQLMYELHIDDISHEKLTGLQIDSRFKKLYAIYHVIDALNNEKLISQSTGEALILMYKRVISPVSNAGIDNYVDFLLSNNMGKGLLDNNFDYKGIVKKYNLDEKENISTLIKKALLDNKKTNKIVEALNFSDKTASIFTILNSIVLGKTEIKGSKKEQDNIKQLIIDAINESIKLAINGLDKSSEETKLSYAYWKTETFENGWTLKDFALIINRFVVTKMLYKDIPIDGKKESLDSLILKNAYDISTESKNADKILNLDLGDNKYIDVLCSLVKNGSNDVDTLYDILKEYSSKTKVDTTVNKTTMINKIFYSLYQITKEGLDDPFGSKQGFALFTSMEKALYGQLESKKTPVIQMSTQK